MLWASRLAGVAVDSAWRNRVWKPAELGLFGTLVLSLTPNPMSVVGEAGYPAAPSPPTRSSLVSFPYPALVRCGSYLVYEWLLVARLRPGLRSHGCRGPMPCRVGFVTCKTAEKRAQRLERGGKGLRCCFHEVEISYLSQPKSKHIHMKEADVNVIEADPGAASSSGPSRHRHQRVGKSVKE